MFLLAGFVEQRYLLLEGFRPRILLSAVTVQAHEREEAVGLAVFRLAIGSRLDRRLIHLTIPTGRTYPSMVLEERGDVGRDVHSSSITIRV